MPPHVTLRPSVPGDRDAVADLALGNAIFEEDELGGVLEAFDSSLDGSLADHRWLAAVDVDDAVLAAVYVAPELFGDRVWNLYGPCDDKITIWKRLHAAT